MLRGQQQGSLGSLGSWTWACGKSSRAGTMSCGRAVASLPMCRVVSAEVLATRCTALAGSALACSSLCPHAYVAIEYAHCAGEDSAGLAPSPGLTRPILS